MARKIILINETPPRSDKYFLSTKNGGYNGAIRPQDYSDGKFPYDGSCSYNCVG